MASAMSSDASDVLSDVLSTVSSARNYDEEWFDKNEDELLIEAAELGLDRELDFNFEDWVEDKFFRLFPEGE